MLGPHAFDGAEKVAGKNDVAIDVTEHGVTRNGLCPSEHVVEEICPELVALDMSFVADAEIAGGLGGALFVAEEDYLDIRMQKRPTLERVALDDVDVPA